MGRRAAVALFAFCVPFSTLPGRAATDDPQTTSSLAPSERQAILQAQRDKTQSDLDRINTAITVSQDTVKRLDAEIIALAADRERIRQAMIAAAAEQKRLSTELLASQGRVNALSEEEGSLKASLRERRAVLAEVLAALQRMGRAPPPALLVKPSDALGSVRSAILLGAVVPEIRSQTDKLLADLSRLSNVRQALDEEKQRFAEALRLSREEEERLSRLSDEKSKLEASNHDRIGQENRRALELGQEATSLQDLIASLQKDMEDARKKEEAERLAAVARAKEEEARLQAEAEQQAKERPDVAPSDTDEETQVAALAPDAPGPSSDTTFDIERLRSQMAQMTPSAPFSTLKGSLVPPVAGRETVRFGKADDFGRSSSGVVFEARPGDMVTAPADGQVLYAGPFRSYGQLLILDAGGGYHIVLAGMSRIDVSVGQFVLSGEPVASIGATRLASVAKADVLGAEPSLYVEFRKDGKPVDPSPWWTDRPSGRTRNDT